LPLKFEKPGQKPKASRIKSRVRLHTATAGCRCVRCGAMDGTVVPAHYSGYRKFQYNFGISQKVDDRLTADLCRACHEEMDQKRTNDVEHSEEFLHLIVLTQLQRTA
jgi:hypothetical protein